MDQADALIGHWLHTEPEEDLEAWAAQVAQAVWMEQRYFETLSQAIHGKK